MYVVIIIKKMYWSTLSGNYLIEETVKNYFGWSLNLYSYINYDGVTTRSTGPVLKPEPEPGLESPLVLDLVRLYTQSEDWMSDVKMFLFLCFSPSCNLHAGQNVRLCKWLHCVLENIQHKLVKSYYRTTEETLLSQRLELLYGNCADSVMGWHWAEDEKANRQTWEPFRNLLVHFMNTRIRTFPILYIL